VSEARPSGEVLAALARAGFPLAELYRKRGRSRHWRRSGGGEAVAATAHEAGWAVRAGARRGSFFAAGTGEEPPLDGWPAPGGPPLRLPAAVAVAPWEEPRDLDQPLLAEGEGLALLAGIERALSAELAGARLLGATLDEGTSEAELASSRGIAASTRQRGAALRIEAAWRTGTATVVQVAREGRSLRPAAVARRLADLLALATASTPAPALAGGELVVDAAVAAELLAALVPLLVGAGAEHRRAPLLDADGRLASAAVTVVDDGRLSGGPLAAAVDGEGLPTGRAVLVEAGAPRRPLLAWWELEAMAAGTAAGAVGGAGAAAGGGFAAGGPAAAGCVRRPSWRDPPRPLPSHLHILPDLGRRVGELVDSVARGAYLLDLRGPARVDLERDRLALPVAGYVLASGSAPEPFRLAWMVGSVSAFLRGIQAVARDLAWRPEAGGLVGAPTLLVGGLDLEPA
jgi:PmbA protein